MGRNCLSYFSEALFRHSVGGRDWGEMGGFRKHYYCVVWLKGVTGFIVWYTEWIGRRRKKVHLEASLYTILRRARLTEMYIWIGTRITLNSLNIHRDVVFTCWSLGALLSLHDSVIQRTQYHFRRHTYVLITSWIMNSVLLNIT